MVAPCHVRLKGSSWYRDSMVHLGFPALDRRRSMPLYFPSHVPDTGYVPVSRQLCMPTNASETPLRKEILL